MNPSLTTEQFVARSTLCAYLFSAEVGNRHTDDIEHWCRVIALQSLDLCNGDLHDGQDEMDRIHHQCQIDFNLEHTYFRNTFFIPFLIPVLDIQLLEESEKEKCWKSLLIGLDWCFDYENLGLELVKYLESSTFDRSQPPSRLILATMDEFLESDTFEGAKDSFQRYIAKPELWHNYLYICSKMEDSDITCYELRQRYSKKCKK
jgi:hypothetical protein